MIEVTDFTLDAAGKPLETRGNTSTMKYAGFDAYEAAWREMGIEITRIGRCHGWRVYLIPRGKARGVRLAPEMVCKECGSPMKPKYSRVTGAGKNGA